MKSTAKLPALIGIIALGVLLVPPLTVLTFFVGGCREVRDYWMGIGASFKVTKRSSQS